jgi:hypothetical protein
VNADGRVDDHRYAGVRRMRAGTLAAATVFAALGAVALIGASGFPDASTYGAPSPRRMPFVYGSALIILAVLLGLRTLRLETSSFSISAPVRLLTFAGLCIVYVAALPQIGFLFLTIPWLLIALFVAGASPRAAVITAVILPVAIDLVFVRALGVPLP